VGGIVKLTRPRIRLACVGSMLVLATACTIGSVEPPYTPPQSSDSQAAAPEDPLVGRLTGELTDAGAMTHLQALQKIADEHGGNRAAGSPG
jgi:aminopeptidase S